MNYIKQNFVNGNRLKAEQLNKIEDAIISKWYGKTINVLGDSITYGVGTSSSAAIFTTLLANMTGATVNNYGISGTKIAGTDSSSFNNRFPSICDNVDLIIVFGGTNDYWHKEIALGEFDSTDTSTFCGAINNIINYHCNNNTNKVQLLFVFPFNQYYGGSSCDTDFGNGIHTSI